MCALLHDFKLSRGHWVDVTRVPDQGRSSNDGGRGRAVRQRDGCDVKSACRRPLRLGERSRRRHLGLAEALHGLGLLWQALSQAFFWPFGPKLNFSKTLAKFPLNSSTNVYYLQKMISDRHFTSSFI